MFHYEINNPFLGVAYKSEYFNDFVTFMLSFWQKELELCGYNCSIFKTETFFKDNKPLLALEEEFGKLSYSELKRLHNNTYEDKERYYKEYLETLHPEQFETFKDFVDSITDIPALLFISKEDFKNYLYHTDLMQ